MQDTSSPAPAGGGGSGVGSPVVVSLKDVLKYRSTYNQFMGHLILEFSIENLLAVTEFMQYREHYHQQVLIMHSMSPISIASLHVDLPLNHKEFPKSALVYHHDMHTQHTQEDMKKCAIALMRKYILNGALFEVNIPYAMRQKYQHMYESESAGNGMWEGETERERMENAIQVFDVCVNELMKLQRDSFSRFLARPVFRQCQEFILAQVEEIRT